MQIEKRKTLKQFLVLYPSHFNIYSAIKNNRCSKMLGRYEHMQNSMRPEPSGPNSNGTDFWGNDVISVGHHNQVQHETAPSPPPPTSFCNLIKFCEDF
jgi:hypothetical protein